MFKCDKCGRELNFRWGVNRRTLCPECCDALEAELAEKDHENLRAELWQMRDTYRALSVAVRKFLPKNDRVVCNRECKGCSAEGKCEDQVLRLCEEKPDGE